MAFSLAVSRERTIFSIGKLCRVMRHVTVRFDESDIGPVLDLSQRRETLYRKTVRSTRQRTEILNINHGMAQKKPHPTV